MCWQRMTWERAEDEREDLEICDPSAAAAICSPRAMEVRSS
jgi:hypothetical protein